MVQEHNKYTVIDKSTLMHALVILANSNTVVDLYDDETWEHVACNKQPNQMYNVDASAISTKFTTNWGMKEPQQVANGVLKLWWHLVGSLSPPGWPLPEPLEQNK